MAFKTPQGGFVAQLMNSGDQDETVAVGFHGRALQLLLPAGSITTARWP